MGEVIAVLIFVPLLFGAAVWAIHRSFRSQEGFPDPKRQGAVVESERGLEEFAPMIGTYHGDEIHEWVKYRGERYDYAYVCASALQAAGEEERALACARSGVRQGAALGLAPRGFPLYNRASPNRAIP